MRFITMFLLAFVLGACGDLTADKAGHESEACECECPCCDDHCEDGACDLGEGHHCPAGCECDCECCDDDDGDQTHDHEGGEGDGGAGDGGCGGGSCPRPEE